MELLRRSLIWIDFNAITTQSLLRGSATLATLQAALLAVSNADVYEDWEGTDNINPAPAPINAQFISVSDQATLLFATSAATVVKITLPAPKSTIFLADTFTVDATAIAAVIAAVIAIVVDPAGNPVTTYLGGTRRKE